MVTDFLFSAEDIFLETIIAIRGRPIFTKKLFLVKETVFFIFFKILTRLEVAFRSSEIAFFKKSFILTSGNGFSINLKLWGSIRTFFMLVGSMLEIRSKPIFFKFFKFLTAEAVFPAIGNGFSGWWKRFLLFRVFPRKWKPSLILVVANS